MPRRPFERYKETETVDFCRAAKTFSPVIIWRCFLVYIVINCTVVNGLAEGDRPDYRRDVKPILTARCGKCHGPDEQEAQVRFDALSIDLSRDRAAAQTWREALNAINAGKMPPDDQPQLGEADRETLTRWISSAIKQAIDEQQSSGGRVVLRRLNRDEYQNTMEDLLGLDMDYARDLPPDGMSSDGFRNNGQALRLSAIQLEYYLDAARRAFGRVIVTGPAPRVFRHQFEQCNVDGWRGPTETSNRLERSQKFLARIEQDYPEDGEFVVRVQLAAELRRGKGFPRLEVAVGYRPDTEVLFRVAGQQEIQTENPQALEFRGRLENFPLPVRGQGKFPGLVVRLMNVYDDGSPPPTELIEIETEKGKKRKGFRPEPELPALRIQSVEFEAPVFDRWPPPLHRAILHESHMTGDNEVQYVKQVLERFVSRAYRRPATHHDVNEMFSFFAEIRPHFTSFEEAIRETLAMVLIQPDFLFLLETAGEQKRSIGDWELASRLSYFLWSTMPDDRLRELAAMETLHQPCVLSAEVERMLGDPRSERFLRSFTDQWLDLGKVNRIAVDGQRYPDFDEELKREMQQETSRFFSHLLAKDLSALNMIRSDFTMLNETLARHYGIDGVLGNEFRAVAALTNRRPGGLLGHASFLLGNSSGKDSHPVRRAVWIRERLLNDPPAPPPPDVPELDEADERFASLSVREQLQLHSTKESCRVCHRDIDPWGIAIENFDAVGLYRENMPSNNGDETSSRPTDAVGVLPDGSRIEGVDELQHYLIQYRREDFARSVAAHLATYALGRSLELSDEPYVDQLTTAFIESGFRLKTLVQNIVCSAEFRSR